MILNFIFSNLNAIVLGVWILFLIIVAIRYYQPLWINSQNKFLSKIINGIKNISFLKLIIVALGLNIFYGLFVTWGQYYVWSNGSAVTKALLNLPLSTEVPFSSYLEWTRPFFSNHLGYFIFYVWGRIWLDIFILFTFSSLLYLIFKIWKFYRGGFIDNGPELMLILMLISGWMGVLVSLSIGFIFSILWVIYSLIRGRKIVAIEPVFIPATLFALIFTKIILNLF